MKIETLAAHTPRAACDTSGAVSVPVYQTATFSRRAIGEGAFNYTRESNPTRDVSERHVALLEGGKRGFAFSSGMAALATLFELFKPGDEIVAGEDLYGGTGRLFSDVCGKNGIIVRDCDTTDIEALRTALTDKTAAVFVEPVSNPMMNVTDIRAVREAAGKRLLIVDNTFVTPCVSRPLELGADVAVHSGTKFLGGHNDVSAGFIVVNDDELAAKILLLQKTIGAGLSPFDAFLVERGIKTLPLRMEKSSANAAKIAERLKSHPKVTRVYYPGSGAMLSFEVDTEKTAAETLSRVELILFAESLGGCETLITYPETQTHAAVPLEKRRALGITPRLLRLSAGIEDAEDLIADLYAALGDTIV